jgi:hypothetical protein
MLLVRGVVGALAHTPFPDRDGRAGGARICNRVFTLTTASSIER